MNLLRVLLLWLGTAGVALAAFVPDPSRRNVDLPPEWKPHEPIPVTIDYFLLDVTSVDGAKETFGASLYFDVKWKDSRMAFDAAAFGADHAIYTGAKADEQLGQMWSPEVTASNLSGDAQIQAKSLTVFSDGRVEFEIRLAGEFMSSMELNRFPFDQQKLSIELESFLWTADQVKLVAVENLKSWNPKLEINGWNIESVSAAVDRRIYVTGDGYSRFTSTIVVNRNPWFYIWSVLFPLTLVTFFAFLCFFWDQETLTERVAQVLTCLLTVTAQSLAVNGDLPKISYFTRIDYAFLLTYVVLLVVAIESIFAKFLNERSHVLADRIDYRSAWIVSIAYTVGMAAIFWIP